VLKGWVAGQGWKRSKSKDASGWEHDGQIVRELKAPEALAGMSGRGSQLSSGRVAWFRFSGRRRNHIRLLDAARGHYAHAIALANAPLGPERLADILKAALRACGRPTTSEAHQLANFKFIAAPIRFSDIDSSPR